MGLICEGCLKTGLNAVIQDIKYFLRAWRAGGGIAFAIGIVLRRHGLGKGFFIEADVAAVLQGLAAFQGGKAEKVGVGQVRGHYVL